MTALLRRGAPRPATRLAGALLALVLAGCPAPPPAAPREAAPAAAPERAALPATADALAAFLRHGSPAGPLVSAHRGGPDEGLPENALTTFAHAAAAGSVIVECDVRRTADGVLALLHDDRLERTTTGKGHLSETPWAEAQALRLRMRGGPTTDHGIPTLAEALAWARGNAILTLDVKPGVPPAEVVEAIRRGDAAGCALVIVYTLEDLLAFTALAPELVYSVSVSREGDLEALLAAGVDTGRVVAFAGVGGCEAALLERLHARGIRAIVGTFGAIDERGRAEGAAPYAELLERGVDIIATDEPLPAVAATRAWRAAAPRD